MLFKVNHEKIDRSFLTFEITRKLDFPIYLLLFSIVPNGINDLRLHTKTTSFPVGLCHNSHFTGMKVYVKRIREVIFVRVFSTTGKRY